MLRGRLLSGWEAPREPRSSFLGMVIEGTESAAISNFPGLIDDVDALRPTTIQMICGVAHRINRDRDWILEAFYKIVGNGDTLRKRRWLDIANVLGNIRLHLPLVLRVSLADIYGQEVGTIFVLAVNLGEIPDLAAERRSSIAAKNQPQRALANPITQIQRLLSIK